MISHILIIDDRISLPRFIAMELREEGYQVSISCNTDRSFIKVLAPDLIILNWELRRLSGFDICRQLRLTSKHIPVIVMTAEDMSDCHLALELGVQACLTKPFSITDLLKTIDYYLIGQKLKCSVCN
jgi:DNA-binding response OmpR family regulator